MRNLNDDDSIDYEAMVEAADLDRDDPDRAPSSVPVAPERMLSERRMVELVVKFGGRRKDDPR